VAIDGRLEWREWESQDGTKRQAVSIIADSVQFLGSREANSHAEPVQPDEDLQPFPWERRRRQRHPVLRHA